LSPSLYKGGGNWLYKRDEASLGLYFSIPSKERGGEERGANVPLKHPIKLGSLSKGGKYLWKRGYPL
jgi:hypothetical protein